MAAVYRSRSGAANIHVIAAHTEDDFVIVREARDKTLRMPQLIPPALSV
jgi:hypothetical protein